MGCYYVAVKHMVKKLIQIHINIKKNNGSANHMRKTCNYY